MYARNQLLNDELNPRHEHRCLDCIPTPLPTPSKKKSTNSKSLQLQLRGEGMLSLQNCPKAERTERSKPHNMTRYYIFKKWCCVQ